MISLRTLFSARVLVVWTLLVLATVVSWTIGHRQMTTGAIPAANVVILVLALCKADLVGRYFMELRNAPRGLRISFDAWCLGVGVLLISLLSAA